MGYPDGWLSALSQVTWPFQILQGAPGAKGERGERVSILWTVDHLLS